MKFQHQTVKRLFNLALRQSVMSQRQCLLSSKQKMCMSHSLLCSLQSPISEMTNCAQVCYLYTCKVAYTVNSLYHKHCRDLELVSSLLRAHNSGSPFQSNVYVCMGFSCCPYHWGACYSGVSARWELNVMAIWSLFKEKTHIIMIK